MEATIHNTPPCIYYHIPITHQLIYSRKQMRIACVQSDLLLASSTSDFLLFAHMQTIHDKGVPLASSRTMASSCDKIWFCNVECRHWGKNK